MFGIFDPILNFGGIIDYRDMFSYCFLPKLETNTGKVPQSWLQYLLPNWYTSFRTGVEAGSSTSTVPCES
jgi:hypothetical protein